MPNISKNRYVSDELPIKTFDSASYQINGGTLIAAATQTADALPFTDTVTVTGVAITDKRLAVSPRDAIVIPTGLALLSVVPSATNTVQITWQNQTLSPIAPPAAGVWSVAILGNFIA
jgi:hypothetical protein